MANEADYKTRLTLLEKIKNQHDELAWSDFVYYYRSYIRSIVLRMNLSQSDADEIVQMVLIKMWSELPKFKYDPGKGRFRGWLCSITGNTAKNYIRDHKSRFTSIDGDPASENKNIDLLTQPEIEKIAEEEWAEYLPKLAWKNISKNFNETMSRIFEMMIEEKSVKAIALKLDISVDKVYVYKQRIRDKIKPEIERLSHELG